MVSDEFFGFAKCDVRVPDEQKEFFSQFPPIFKNVEVSNNDVGPYMKGLLNILGRLKKPRRTLISSFFGEGVVLTTDQIKCREEMRQEQWDEIGTRDTERRKIQRENHGGAETQ